MVYLYEALVKLKPLDVECAQACLDAAEMDADEFSDYVYEYLHNIGGYLDEIDIVSLCYKFITNQAGLPELTKHIHANYLDTRFNLSKDHAKEILRKIPKSKRNSAWFWIKDNI